VSSSKYVLVEGRDGKSTLPFLLSGSNFIAVLSLKASIKELEI